jgi:hypothetical protein
VAALRPPDISLRIGFRYLHELMQHYDGDAKLALTAYNRGPGTVDRALKKGANPDNGYAGMVFKDIPAEQQAHSGSTEALASTKTRTPAPQKAQAAPEAPSPRSGGIIQGSGLGLNAD